MELLFLICALAGGTILAWQFLLTIFGLGDLFSPGDLEHTLGDAPVEFETDGSAELSHETGLHHSHGVAWFFSVLSLRTLIAALTFFGLAGMAVNRAGGNALQQLAAAGVAGMAALLAVHWLMQSFMKLGQNSTLRMHNAIGQSGLVTVAIPNDPTCCGKVQISIQGRLEEFAAVSNGFTGLTTGTPVTVVSLTRGNVLEVQSALAPAHVSSPLQT